MNYTVGFIIAVSDRLAAEGGLARMLSDRCRKGAGPHLVGCKVEAATRVGPAVSLNQRIFPLVEGPGLRMENAPFGGWLGRSAYRIFGEPIPLFHR